MAWGAITGTVTDQTDLVTYVTGLGYLTDAPSDGNEYVRKNAAWAIATGGGGGLTISDLSNGATSTLDATAPTTGQALTYDGTDLIWATVSASASWGSITGTLSSQTDLQTELDGKLPVKTVNDQSANTAYTLASSDANMIVYSTGASSLTLTIPKDSTYSFAVGTHIMIAADGSPNISIIPEDGMTPAPLISGTTSITATTIVHAIKVAADRWIIS